uniref:Uncharacterized protein n=1 Tax=Rhizophora mucronata TaxID=61149 RepID=A0A2P2NJD1_RHIMU
MHLDSRLALLFHLEKTTLGQIRGSNQTQTELDLIDKHFSNQEIVSKTPI